nr:MAG TPA: hypothetical protein [Caudoviricetes sp.]
MFSCYYFRIIIMNYLSHKMFSILSFSDISS